MSTTIHGMIDLHLHGMPSLVQRMNPWDYVMEMEQAGYAACVIQDHSGSTAGLAYAIMNGPVKLNIQVFGTLVMNAAGGGIQAACVESAHRMGARRISFPTTSSPQQNAYLKKYNLTFGGGALHSPESRVSPLDSDGKLTAQTMEVLDYIQANPQLILSTGYMSPGEIDAVVEEALGRGLTRVVVDHPYAIVEAAHEQIVKWAKQGAYMELTAANFKEISVSGNLEPAYLKEVMDGVPVEQIILSSDFGQVRNGSPVAGLQRLMDAVSSFGYSDAAIEQMVKGTPGRLLFG